MNLDKNALIETAKSFGRFIWFGLLALVVTFLTSLISGGTLNDAHVTIAGQTINVGFILLAGLTVVIKGIDRYRHVSENTESKGIAPPFLQQ